MLQCYVNCPKKRASFSLCNIYIYICEWSGHVLVRSTRMAHLWTVLSPYLAEANPVRDVCPSATLPHTAPRSHTASVPIQSSDLPSTAPHRKQTDCTNMSQRPLSERPTIYMWKLWTAWWQAVFDTYFLLVISPRTNINPHILFSLRVSLAQGSIAFSLSTPPVPIIDHSCFLPNLRPFSLSE